MSRFKRGSEWRKWDLHLHTPSSYDYKDKSISNEQIIEQLVKNDISVAAITDHHIIDVERIKSLQEIARGRVTILPGIELRTELGGSESIHIIGIFSEDADIETIWTKLQGKFDLTSADVKEKGHDKIYCDFVEVSKFIKDAGGIITVHAGKKTNSLENITNSLTYKMALKTYLATKVVDIFELGRTEDQKIYNEKVFPNIEKVLPMIICSDNHDIKDYKINDYCWIKADPCFEGLKQVLNEPKERVYIGYMPDKLKLIQINKHNYIKNIRINKRENSTLNKVWFDNEIELNYDLVTIIGNKGSGKSALVDIIGLVGGSKNRDYFSFLNKKRFRKKPENYAKEFEAIMTWADGSSKKKSLDDNVESFEVEKIKYLPQQYIEKVCNDLGDSFQEEINKMVFSYIPVDERLGKTNFKELMDHICLGIDEQIRTKKSYLTDINKKIIGLETKLTKENINKLINLFHDKRKEFKTHIREKPLPVKEPILDKEIDEKIKKIESKLITLENISRIKEKELNSISKKIFSLNIIKDKLISFEANYKLLISEINEILQLNGIEIDLKINFNYNLKELELKLEKLHKTKQELNEILEKDKEKQTERSIYKKIEDLNKLKKSIQSRMNEEQKKYQNYLSELKLWKKRKKEIIGTKDDVNSLKYYLEELKYIKRDLNKELDELKLKRYKICEELYNLKIDKANKYKEKYKYIVNFLDRYKKQNKIKDYDSLNFSVEIMISKNFVDKFLNFINQNVLSIFKGKLEGKKNLVNIINKYNFNKKEDVLRFINEIYEEINKDESRINSLLKDRREFYDYLFSLDYLEIDYKLNLGDKPLDQLSPGEKGALLLIFYLVLDKDNNPLIIDQPEDNLDNQSIYEKLVPYIREAKKRRQLIIVTHNPNIAIACDSEQVIYVEMKKENYEIKYLSGSIENTEIKKHIVDVLEGTFPAFNLRKRKYS